jgi:beta-carotene/zeaxanthin 4-ketolase
MLSGRSGMMGVALSRSRQRRIGLVLAALITGAWLAIHVGGIFFVDLDWSSAPAVALAILVQTWLSTGLFILAHDAMHGALVPGRPRLNRALGAVSLGLYAGLSYRQLAPKHAAHHHRPGTADDPDFHAPDPHRPLPWFTSFFRSYYTHGQILRITAAAILYMLLGAELLNIIVFWAVPALLALFQLFWFGTYLPHRHESAAFADHHHARSTALGPLASLLTCFHFGGYHHEHHLSPATPWWALPRLRRA